MLERAAAAVLAHLLQGEDWARERLRPHAGRALRLVMPPFRLDFAVTPDGGLAPGNAESEPALTVEIPPSLLARAALDGQEALREARVAGDADLARDIAHVAAHLRWDAEEDLSRVFGDVAAHRIAAAGAAFARWQRETARDATRAVAEFLTEERPAVAARPAVEGFLRDVDALRDDCARLEARIRRLEAARRGES